MLYQNAELYNVQELVPVEQGEGWQLSRVPDAVRRNLNEAAQQTAFNGSGCEIRFNLRGEQARILLRREPGAATIGLLEVYHGPFSGQYTETPRYIGQDIVEIMLTRQQDTLPQLKQLYTSAGHAGFDPALIRIILPYDWSNRLIAIEGDIEPPRPEQVPARKYLAYGSSITHGGNSSTPTGSYAMRTARILNADLTNLGFAGSAHMDEALAEYIAQLGTWDIATLEMGINVIGTWSTEDFKARTEAFVTRIAQQNQDKWIFCIDLFTMNMDIIHDPRVNAYRQAVKEVVERLRLPRLIYLPGNELLTTAGLSIDLVHPSDLGMEIIANRLAQKINQYIQK
ncbi:SGNH/GDSL hydrolase family protein [Dictyobacter kobayashii]|uniref:SGNH hydrolase-type esterase domain-containing protein n=1 Tax=Dictyobacter kobayashii TaxID=2014872 RepID=A0A402AU98_9CHLR|nr:SGNH/GDSL hydrolase family protein [Dictyobacter kobayashii]GCE22692.1 hypothetical protein KDK_64920 [Dictyobacter kobayashii]